MVQAAGADNAPLVVCDNLVKNLPIDELEVVALQAWIWRSAVAR